MQTWSYARSETSFNEAGVVFLRSESEVTREYRVVSVKSHKNIFLMRLEGLNSRDEAEQFREAEIFIRKESLTREEGEYYWYELLGLKAYMDTGEYLGRIKHIISAGSNDVYVIQEGERELLIPATHEVVKEIDLENRKIIISPMEGLLDLNEV